MKLFFRTIVILFGCVILSADLAAEPDSMIGALGGVFAKSNSSDAYYFIAPYSLRYVGKVYSFSSLKELIRELPVVGQPVYWMNYNKSLHSDLHGRSLKLTPLSEGELATIEEFCLGGIKSFPRFGDERHPALPIPPTAK